MARQANIVAFDEVKKASSVTRSSTSRAKKQPVGKRAASSTQHASQSTKKNRAKHTNNVHAGKSRNASLRGADSQEATSQDAATKNTRKSRAAERKRSRTKAKAEKAFTKQFSGKESSSAASEGAPRAALYKAEMGKSHKRATKAVQPKRGSSSASNKSTKPQLRDRFNLDSSRQRATVILTFCLLAACIFIYPSAQQYYVANRQHAQLEAEYEALQARNNTIRSEVDTLMTDEGVEDRARQEFGWVKPGENSVSVYGLSEHDDRLNYTKAIPTGSVEAPATWYSPFLDFIFNV